MLKLKKMHTEPLMLNDKQEQRFLTFDKNDFFVLGGLLLLVIILFFSKIGSLPLFDPDEPRYAAAAKGMVETGDWIVPYFNGMPRLNKPPLFYWLVALSFKFFGVSELSARLPSLLFGIGGVIIAFIWARSIWGRWKAFSVGFFLSICPLYISISRLCITDMTMSFFLYLGLYNFYQGYKDGGYGKGRKYLIYFSLAMMFLVKGHVGILLFMFVVSVFLVTVKDLKFLVKLWDPVGLTIFFMIILPWGLMFIHNVGLDTITGLVTNETYGRFVGGYQHPEPFYFYAMVFFFGFFPLSFFIPLMLLFCKKARGARCRFVDSTKNICLNMKSKDINVKFFSVWLIVVILFFSLSKSKLFTYILPMAPAVPFLFVSAFSGIEIKKKSKLYAFFLLIFLIFFAFSIITLVFLPDWIGSRYLTSNRVNLMSWLFCICMAVTVVGFLVKGLEFGKFLLGCTTYILLLLIILNLHIFIGNNRSAKYTVNEYLPPNGESYILLSYRKLLSSLVFYTGKRVGLIEPWVDGPLSEFDTEGNDVYIYMRHKDYRRHKDDEIFNDFELVSSEDGPVVLKKIIKPVYKSFD